MEIEDVDVELRRRRRRGGGGGVMKAVISSIPVLQVLDALEL